jgi:imidazole glycerol-phosphate synthase subunit HisH
MIAIVKYNAGNVTSVKNALRRFGYPCKITDVKNEIINAEKVIFPGVGEAKSAIKYLREKGIDEVIRNLKQPVLGICLGLQLMCKYSEEGNTEGLGIFDNVVKIFPPEDLVPHIGWNNVTNRKGILYNNLDIQNDFYFVHSYYAEINEDTTGICDYILPFSASIQKNNFFATQFHPEKSASAGEKIIKNFLSL